MVDPIGLGPGVEVVEVEVAWVVDGAFEFVVVGGGVVCFGFVGEGG